MSPIFCGIEKLSHEGTPVMAQGHELAETLVGFVRNAASDRSGPGYNTFISLGGHYVFPA